MENIVDYPPGIFAAAFVIQWLAAWIGAKLGLRLHGAPEDVRSDYNIVLGATLTLLGLIIAFSFSMALGRYDQRKNYEEAEANAIGTEYVRADVLPQADGDRVRELLKQYTDLRIRFYITRDKEDLRRIDADTMRVQSELWTAAARPGMAQPNQVVALAVSGMNDVINSQGYTQAAWLYRIPAGAWALMFATAIFSNLLLGVEVRRFDLKLFTVLPLVIAVSFLLIADIDSPRRGMIRVHPLNLESLRGSLK